MDDLKARRRSRVGATHGDEAVHTVIAPRGPGTGASGIRLEWLQPPGHQAAGAPMVAAFAREPGWTSELNDPVAREQVLSALVSVMAADAARHGMLLAAIEGTDVVGGACIWEPAYHPGLLRTPGYLNAGLAVVRHTGIGALRLLRRWRAMRAVDPRVGHWHLALIGVPPEHQGRGIGTALLSEFLRHVDATGIAAYLETNRLELVRWYSRAGFAVRDELRLTAGRRAWTMWREPDMIRRRDDCCCENHRCGCGSK